MDSLRHRDWAGRWLALVAALLLQACAFSPVGAYRELRSDRHTPTVSDLVGTWTVTPESAAIAADTGLPMADVKAGFISMRPDGSCTGDLYESACGSIPNPHRKPTEICRWAVSTYDKPTVVLTFGRGDSAKSLELHRLESDPPILWQYICDPDAADYLAFRRTEH
jgi:hypothetical protein